jgi:hypothetical protein
MKKNTEPAGTQHVPALSSRLLAGLLVQAAVAFTGRCGG